MLSQNNNSPVISNAGGLAKLHELIASAKHGDKEAFEVIYKQLFTPLYRYVLSRCHDIDLTQDVCQQTFMKFYEALPSYEPNKSPLAYLFTIAKHLLINHQEKHKTIPFDESILESNEDESIDVMQESHVRKLAESINNYLPSLTSDEQEMIRLYFYAELSYKEISDILEKDETYLRKIKERALKKLRILTKHLYDGK